MKNRILILVFLIAILSNGAIAQNTKFDTSYLELKNEYISNKLSEKVIMLEFIKNNISIHYTDNYFWQDSIGGKVNFDELIYADFNTAVKNFDVIKTEKGKLSPIATRKDDKHLLTKDILKQNIDATYESEYYAKYSNDNYSAAKLAAFTIASNTSIEFLIQVSITDLIMAKYFAPL